MATTTNFGWTTPDDTALVKDGASAIRTLGSSIDTSMAQLKGGTTGQILSKTSNSDMAFTWIANDQGDITAVTAGTGLTGGGTTGAVTLSLDSTAVISPTIVDAKGDLIAATGADTVARLAVGSNDQVLTADSTTATGLKWATVSTGNTWTLLNAGGTAMSGSGTITISGITSENLLIFIQNSSSASASSNLRIRFNSDTGTNYNSSGFSVLAGSTYSNGNFNGLNDTTSDSITLAQMGSNAAASLRGALQVSGCKSTASKVFWGSGGGTTGGGSDQILYSVQGWYAASAAITSVSVISSVGNFDAGTLYVYGA